MTTTLREDVVPAPAATRSYPSIRAAGHVLALGVALGVIGQYLFFGVGLGVNAPLAIGLVVAAGWLSRRRDAPLRRAEVMLAAAAVGFATFAAIRADPTIVRLDMLASLALAAGSLAAFGGLRVLGRPFSGLVGIQLRALGWAAFGAVAAVADARDELPSTASLRPRLTRSLPLVRGLLVAIPVALVFISLFSAADPVFARVISDLFGVRLQLGELPGRIMLALALGWIAAGALAFSAAAHPPESVEPSSPVEGGWRIGTVEATTVLVVVDAIFVLFVALQVGYLFGGLDTLEAVGLTYSDYARRGFIELVVVVVLAGSLVIGLERLTRRRDALLLASAVGLALLVGVVLASATLRLQLYQQAYGWTELRFYVIATIGVLAVGVVALVGALATDRMRWIGHALLGAALAVGFVLNVIGPVRFIAEQNVARAIDPTLVPPHGHSGLDELYTLSLGDEALPSLVRVLPEIDPANRIVVAETLRTRLGELRSDPGLNAWQAWNGGRAAARDALEQAAARGELP